jgi:outer membrane protein TolC
MKIFRPSIACIAVCRLVLLWGGALFVAPLSAQPEILTLPRARELALQNSFAVKKAELAITSSGLDREALVSDFMPVLSAQGSLSAGYPVSPMSDNSVFDTSAGYGVSLNQKIYSGGTRINALRQNAVQALDVREALRSARLSVLGDTDTRYLGVLESLRKKEAADKDLEAAGRQLELAEALVSVGRLDGSGLLKARSSFASKRTAAVQARYDLVVSSRKLASHLGIAGEFAIAPLDEGVHAVLSELLAAMDMDRLDGLARELAARAGAGNPDLLRKDLALESGRLGVETKKAAFLPSLSLSWSHGWNTSDFGPVADSGKLTLSGSVPIFPRSGKAAEVSKAETNLQASRHELENAREQTGLSIYGALLDLVSALHRIESAGVSLAYAEQHYEGVFEKFRLSAATLSDLSDAEALLSSARTGEISSRFAFYRSWTSLIYLTGEEKESGLLDLFRG